VPLTGSGAAWQRAAFGTLRSRVQIPPSRLVNENGRGAAILIAGANLSLDRTITLDDIEIGRIHRTEAVDVRGGGKGVNVARALRCVGVESHNVGYSAGIVGRAIVELIRSEGLSVTPVEVAGEARSCLTVLARRAETTVFNEPGPSIGEPDFVRLEDAVGEELDAARVFVCSGSWPPGSPLDSAARLIARARDQGCVTVLDTSGQFLVKALSEHPDVIKPNVSEARAALGTGAAEMIDGGHGSLEQAAEAAEALLERGPRAVIVTAGSAGAVLARPEGTEVYQALSVDVVNPVGAGDAVVAGVAAGLADGEDLPAALRRGMAMGAASCETVAAALLDGRRAAHLLEEPRHFLAE
jgi:tagatose 6-phosphate kinase